MRFESRVELRILVSNQTVRAYMQCTHWLCRKDVDDSRTEPTYKKHHLDAVRYQGTGSAPTIEGGGVVWVDRLLDEKTKMKYSRSDAYVSEMKGGAREGRQTFK